VEHVLGEVGLDQRIGVQPVAMLGGDQDADDLDRPRVPVRVAGRVESRAGRTDFVRSTLTWREDGLLWATPAGAQVSGHLGPQSRAHGLLVVPEASERLEPGERAMALVLRPPEG